MINIIVKQLVILCLLILPSLIILPTNATGNIVIKIDSVTHAGSQFSMLYEIGEDFRVSASLITFGERIEAWSFISIELRLIFNLTDRIIFHLTGGWIDTSGLAELEPNTPMELVNELTLIDFAPFQIYATLDIIENIKLDQGESHYLEDQYVGEFPSIESIRSSTEGSEFNSRELVSLLTRGIGLILLIIYLIQRRRHGKDIADIEYYPVE